MRYAVRCCCQPQKILGWLDGPDHVPNFRVSEVFEPHRPHRDSSPLDMAPTHLVEVRNFMHEDGSVERAIYSEERPLEFWKKIRGFTPT